MNRRHFLSTSALTATASAAGLASAGTERRMGITMASYMIRWRHRNEKTLRPGWENALDVLDHCQDLGAGCLQIGVHGWTTDFAGAVREKRESLGIVLEGQVGLPRRDESTARFESDVKAAAEAGATILRTVCLGQRRYEKFETLDEWKTFVKDSRTALERAEPILSKHGMKLAVENHKDWRIDEQLELLNHLSSEAVGVTLDFGNNLALLEDPLKTVKALAPYLMSTHLKDMAMAEYEHGFLLSEVPLGEGILDLKRMIAICIRANPSLWFNLEMITRDPLEIPVFEDKYWTTMAQVKASDLAGTLKLAKSGKRKMLPAIGEKDLSSQISLEEANIRKSFSYGRQQLGFT